MHHLLGLFVANWRKWSLTLDIGSCMYPKNTMFPARFWMQVIRAMLSKSAEPNGSHVALGRLNEETAAEKSDFSFPRRCLIFSSKLNAKLLFNACAVTLAQISHQCKPERCIPKSYPRRIAYA